MPFTTTITAFLDARSSFSIFHLSSAYYWVVQDISFNWRLTIDALNLSMS